MTASVPEQPSDLETLAAEYETQASLLDRDLRVKVSARQTTTEDELRAATQIALRSNRADQECKAARDHLLRQAIGAHLLNLTNQIEHHHVEGARETVGAIERAYRAQTQVHAVRAQVLHVAATVVVAVEEIANESIKALRLLEYAIAALLVTYQRNTENSLSLARRIEHAIQAEIGDLRQLLLDEELTPEAYAEALVTTIETTLDTVAPDEAKDRETRKRFILGTLASSAGAFAVNLASSAVWDEKEAFLDARPWNGLLKGKEGTASSTRSKRADNLVLRWFFETGSWAKSSPVCDGMIYVGCTDGNVYAVDTTTGRERWRVQISGSASTPVVADKIVFVAGHRDGVHALDAETGRELWRYEVGPRDTFTPVVAEGLVYVRTTRARFGIEGDGHEELDQFVYALDAVSGKEHWRFGVEDERETLPVVADGLVFVDHGNGSLHALDAATGKERWRLETGRKLRADQPVVVDGTAYFGGRDHVYAVDSATGRERWHSDSDYRLIGPLIVNGKVIYVRRWKTVSHRPGQSEYLVDALDTSTGRKRWSSKFVSHPHFFTLTLGEGFVYVGRAAYTRHPDEYLYCIHALDADMGSKRWTFESKTRISAPEVLAGMIVFDDKMGLVHMLDATSGQQCGRFPIVGETFSLPIAAADLAFIRTSGRAVYAVGAG